MEEKKIIKLLILAVIVVMFVFFFATFPSITYATDNCPDEDVPIPTEEDFRTLQKIRNGSVTAEEVGWTTVSLNDSDGKLIIENMCWDVEMKITPMMWIKYKITSNPPVSIDTSPRNLTVGEIG